MLDVRKMPFPCIGAAPWTKIGAKLFMSLEEEEDEEQRQKQQQQRQEENADNEAFRLPLYLRVAMTPTTTDTATGADAVPEKDWHVSHLRGVCEKTCYIVIPVPGYAQLMRDAIEGAISTENVRRLVAGRGEPFLAKYPVEPDRDYARRVEIVTRDLFSRLQKQTADYVNPMRKSILDATSVTDMIRLLFGEFIWRTNQESAKAEGLHLTTIRVTKRVNDLSLFTRTFGTDATFTEEEMRFMAYACAVLAYGSGFYIYNYEERRLDRHQTPPEDIVLEIAWVY